MKPTIPNTIIRILIVDDQKMVREILRERLEGEPDLEIVGTANDGEIAIEQVKLLQPDIVLIDLEMPKLDGISATKIICQEFTQVKVLVLSQHESDEYIFKSFAAGAMGYLLKTTPAKELQETIRFVYRGYTQIGPGLFDKLIPKFFPEEVGFIDHSLEVQSSVTSVRSPTQDSRVTPISISSSQQIVSVRNSLGEKLSENPPNYLPPATPQEFLPPIGRWLSLGGFVLLGAFASAVALASILTYKVTVKAPATVRPVGELSLVQPLREGKVKQIELNVNQQKVRAGEIIAYLDDSQLQTKKRQLQGNLQQAKEQMSQLNAQVDAIDRQIAVENEQMERILVAAQAELRLTQRNYEDKSITSVTEVEQAEAKLQLAVEDWQRAQAELRSAQAQLQSIEAAWKSAVSKLDRYQTVADSGALPQNQLEEAKLAVQQQEQALYSQRATVQAHQHTVERQSKEIEAAQGKLRQVQSALNPSLADVEIAQQRIAQEKARGESTLANLKRERAQLVQQRVGMKNQLTSDQAELQQVEVELKNTVIRAPVSGIIQELTLRNPEQVVRPGDVIARIAPSDAPLEIKALVASQDITKVEVGQTVQFRVSACPYPDYGTLKGKVTAIAPDTSIPQENSRDISSVRVIGKGNLPTYAVTIKPEGILLKGLQRNCPIQAGMDGRADIISREETVLQFILRKTKLNWEWGT